MAGTGPTGRTIVIGYGYWGSGTDLKAAKAEFTRQGGRLSDGYNILQFDPDTSFEGVDQMGSVYWLGNEPTETKVAPRVKARR
jgi:hypothetical protein